MAYVNTACAGRVSLLFSTHSKIYLGLNFTQLQALTLAAFALLPQAFLLLLVWLGLSEVIVICLEKYSKWPMNIVIAIQAKWWTSTWQRYAPN